VRFGSAFKGVDIRPATVLRARLLNGMRASGKEYTIMPPGEVEARAPLARVSRMPVFGG